MEYECDSLDTARSNFICPEVSHDVKAKGNSDHREDSETYVAFAIDCRNHRVNEEVSGTIQSKENGGQSLNYQNPVLYVDASHANHVARVSDISGAVQSRDEKGGKFVLFKEEE